MRPAPATTTMEIMKLIHRYAELIGIADLGRPDYGDAVTVGRDELPLFWACGVTPQLALANARLPLAITHRPGCMLVTDVRNSQLAVL